ncbi:MAG: LPXTG cell wall anchor domain-containing protein, partial [Acidimicrobiaceae bacterium]|nr:LPXTG cell wall anchor domain-containing protein [Acidimicrobiaceae bacterium]
TLVLQQSLNGHVQCVSPDATCTIVNLYGQGGDPGPSFITPGEQHVTTVDLTNAGTLAASSLTVVAGSCTSQLCETVTVTILCTTGGTASFSFGPATLTAFGASGTHLVANGLAAGASSTCTFTVEYPANAPFIAPARSVQPVTWTLTAPEVPPTTTIPPPTTIPPTTTVPPPTTVPPATTIPPATTSPAPPPPSTVPPAPPTTKVSGPPAVPPPVVGPPAPPSLAVTGTDALVMAIAGLVLLAIGAFLLWLSRRRDEGHGVDSPPVAESR